MELRQLEYFVTVAEELHFGRAAERLHMSQPPLSVQIRKLEQELGVRLLERTTRQVELTPAGRTLHERLRPALAALDDCFAGLRDFETGHRGTLHAGFVSSANYTVLPGATTAFRTQRPHVALRLEPLTSGEQFARLQRGALDVGIIRDEIADGGLLATVILEERLVACLPTAHPLAGQAEVTAAELAEVPMITYPSAMMPGYTRKVRAALGAERSRVQVVEEVIHQESALGFVAIGAGMTILPESVTVMLPRAVVAVPIAGAPRSQLLAVTPADTPRSALVQAFVACLAEAALPTG